VLPYGIQAGVYLHQRLQGYAARSVAKRSLPDPTECEAAVASAKTHGGAVPLPDGRILIIRAIASAC